MYKKTGTLILSMKDLSTDVEKVINLPFNLTRNCFVISGLVPNYYLQTSDKVHKSMWVVASPRIVASSEIQFS